MSLKAVALRIPPLFLIDFILKTNMGLGDLDGTHVPFTIFKFVACLLGVLCCGFTIIAPLLVLRKLYVFVISVAVIVLSYWSNMSAINLISDSPNILQDILSLNVTCLPDPGGAAVSILCHFIGQWLMGLLFAHVHYGPRNEIVQKWIPYNLLMPILLAMLPLPHQLLMHSPAFAAILPVVLSIITLWTSRQWAVNICLLVLVYFREYETDAGMNKWNRLDIHSALRTCWILRTIGQLFSAIVFSEEVFLWSTVAQNLLAGGCETLIAIMGMASIVSAICLQIEKLVQLFVPCVIESHRFHTFGSISFAAFVNFTMEYGLTSLSPDKRFAGLCRNLCRLTITVLNLIHLTIKPVWISLNATGNPSRKKYARTLLLYMFVLVVAIALVAMLWTKHSSSTWLLTVTIFAVQFIVNVLVTLSTHTLVLLDARRQTSWEKLDDCVYYMNAFSDYVQLSFDIFLSVDHLWVLVFESEYFSYKASLYFFEHGAIIRVASLTVIAQSAWCEAQAMWAEFMKRRKTAQKISSLADASETQLGTLDVCSICYQVMFHYE
ncbi:Protein TRC8 like [Pseudolycoriella hygida]|uniref:Protein TRC8 like n=1 Tax=Pseudolycoriella hygida TaxID=35572 RepID=A0A9Q0MYX4_9DIPT|nr:Protein TRC8 like [Pseudolycoriella hygida]